MYALAIRDGAELFLVLLVRRDVKGDLYTIYPRREPGGWNPHTSYHASGQHHQKIFGRGFMVCQRQKPDTDFCGTENVTTIGVAADEPRAINMLCKPERFAAVLEVPIEETRSDKYRTFIAVDLAQPGGQPIILPEARIIRQAKFTDAIPWILITVFEAPPKQL